MPDIARPCVYFEQPGKDNTNKVVDIVTKRLAEGGITTVAIASTTGYTALKFSEASEKWDDVTLISVAEGARIREWDVEYPTLKPEHRQELEQRGVVVAAHVPYLFHSSVLEFSRWQAPVPEDIIRDTLYAFGQGLKVAVEVVLIAVASGFLEPFQDVIAVGGTHRGADTAIVVRATYPNHVLSQDPDKRLRIHEILCMPQ
ncbi:MAG: hypothetical protein AMJ93_10160 [Anaerolineae bacterium SM23_84]|nr:MAG: hypothetical protein AMJ93_10160 [Anaerolineae bacterium SM23_84]